MFVIRPVTENDFDDLMHLISQAGYGLTSLPNDQDVIKKRIAHSIRSFAHKDKERPGGELYLFVMEEVFLGKIVGVSGVVSKIGGFDPIYFYKLKKQKRLSKSLNVENEFTAMHLDKVYDGPAEICSLFLAPEYRNSQNGRFLSLSRFAYMANNKNFFEKEVIAEMRGRVDENGNSPFWEAVGKKFFKVTFLEADYMVMKNKAFIEELLPNYPIIKELLPIEAQEVIGEVHSNTEPALRILTQEGFKKTNQVAIFEPGPIVKAKVEDIRTIKEIQTKKVGKIERLKEEESPCIISNLSSSKFKACLGDVKILENGEIAISSVAASALSLRLGDDVSFVSLKSSRS
jgi:arginine N-succinyltransferase